MERETETETGVQMPSVLEQEMQELRKRKPSRKGSEDGDGMETPDLSDEEDEEEEEEVSELIASTKISPVNLSWNNLGCWIPASGADKKKNKKKAGTSEEPLKAEEAEEKNRKRLLKGVTGQLKKGQLLAIMGPSGAGKTTMLNLLAGRAPKSQTSEGEVRINGKRVEERLFKTFVGFVTQEDVMQPFLTVKEIVRFYARLRLPSSMSTKEKDRKAKEVITLLGLAKCQNTIIGNSIVKGISGGEKKRVNIAIELLSQPSILFLDEPTSGLDAFTALNLIKLLRRLAKASGMLIICTIHQPRVQIFNRFDLLLLLGQGETVYFGPTRDAVDYFARAGHPIPPFSNPADFFLDTITPDNTSPSKALKRQKQIEELIALHASLQAKQGDIESGIHSGGPAPIASSETIAPLERKSSSAAVLRRRHSEMKAESAAFLTSMQLPKKPGYFQQVWYILLRDLLNQVRNVQFLCIRFFSALFMGTIVGFTWFQLDDKQQDVMDRNGFLFFALTFACFNEMNATINTFPPERAVFLHDRAAGVYKVSSYLTAKFLSDLPLHILIPFLFIIETYWLVGLEADAKSFFVVFFTMVMAGLVTSSMGLFLAAATKDANGAVASSTVLMILSMLFGGFFIAPPSIPDYFLGFHYGSLVKYAFSNLLLSQYSSDTKIKCPAHSQETCQYQTGQDVLDAYNADETEIWQNFLVLIGFMSMFLTGAYLALRFLNRRR